MESESFEGGKGRWYRYIECWDCRLDSSLGEGGSIQVEEDGAWETVGDNQATIFVNRYIQSLPPLKLRETLSGLTGKQLANAWRNATDDDDRLRVEEMGRVPILVESVINNLKRFLDKNSDRLAGRSKCVCLTGEV
jgi:hypothetical protein